MKTRIRLYVGAICVGALAAIAALYLHAPYVSSSHVIAALLLASIGLASELMTYELPNGGTASIAFVPFAAAVLLSPTWAAPVAVGAAVLLTQVMNRREPIKAVFNIGQALLATAMASHAFRLTGGHSFLDVPTGTLDGVLAKSGIAAALVLFVIILVNTVSVSGVLALSGRASLRTVWKANTLTTLSYTLISGPIAVVLAWVFTRMGPVWAIGLAIPVLGLRQLYAATLQLRQSNTELLELMVKAIEARDPYTSGHSRRVSQSATVIAKALGLRARDVERVRIAALLHDVGKIHEDFATILRKPGRLTDEEWEVMKTHPGRGADLVTTMSHLRDLVPAIRHHHERWDGKGYPAGISGEAIPLAARIITIADVMDALATDRPYRAAMSEAEVRAEFIKCRGTQFDPAIVDRILASSMWSQIFPQERRRTPSIVGSVA